VTSQAGSLRLGVFGGAFDPPHAAHHALVEAALDQLRLDRIQVMPTGQAWHKSRVLSDATHRVAMARLAFADLPGVHIDTREIERPGPSYTIDSLRELRREQPDAELFLIIGEDQARSLQSWREWQAVVALAIICVAARPHAADQTARFAPPIDLQQRFVHLQLPMSTASATEIRQRARTDQGIVPLVCDDVARYIVLHRLYRPT